MSRKSDLLSDFVRDALVAGRSRDEVRAALSEAGWATKEINEAIGAWGAGDFTPPVPRPRSYLTAREFFRHAVLLVALAVTTGHLTNLVTILIDGWYTSPETYPWRTNQMRWDIAVLVVFAPLFLWFDHRSTTALKKDPGQRRSVARQWYVYLSTFGAIGVLLGDLVWVIYRLLTGDLTGQFLLKAAAVAVIAGAVLWLLNNDLKAQGDHV
jgi:Domain of unknown function (DUF5671)